MGEKREYGREEGVWMRVRTVSDKESEIDRETDR